MKIRFFTILFLFSFLLVFAKAEAHPYHVSIADAKYNAKTRKLEVALKVFTDDLEKTLSEEAKKPVILKKNPEAAKQLETYLKKTISFSLPNKTLSLNYLGAEPESDTHWLYFEVAIEPENLQQLKIRNQLLSNTFEDQVNLMNFEVKGEKKTLMFRQEETVKMLF